MNDSPATEYPAYVECLQCGRWMTYTMAHAFRDTTECLCGACPDEPPMRYVDPKFRRAWITTSPVQELDFEQISPPTGEKLESPHIKSSYGGRWIGGVATGARYVVHPGAS